jgi:hypothetical protein
MRPGRISTLYALLLAAVVSTNAVCINAETRSNGLCSEVPAISQQLTEITGLEWKRPVPCSFISKEQVNSYLKKRVKEVASPEEIRAEELTLKKFGLVPQDFDLAASTVDLLTEQAAAFYDYNKKKLFITESTSTETQEPVLAHELAHALADQNFNLARYIKQGRKSDDGSTARLAVMEGQATWIMSEYLARKGGQTLKGNPGLATMMAGLSDSGGGQFPVFDTAPLYLRRTLIFPYTKGMVFQNAVLDHDGPRGFGEVFRNPPVSTQQILHPEAYFAGQKPTHPALPEPKLGSGYKSLVGGTLGELEHSILLEQYDGKETAREISPHWRGSTFELRENRKAKRVVLLYAVEWEDEASAHRYFDAYRHILAKKWKAMSVQSESEGALTGLGDDGKFELRRQGALVTSVEGMEPGVN